MKKTSLLLIFSVLFWVVGYGQNIFHQTDFDSINNFTIEIDTSSQNVWQIGKPQKTYFDTAYNGQKAILTDTINPYPSGNISRFTINLPSFIIPHGILLNFRFKHKMQSRSHQDGGYIEYSTHGQDWRLISDSASPFGYVFGPYIFWGVNNMYGKDSIKSDTLYNGHLGFSGTYDWTESKITFLCMALKRSSDFQFRFTFVSDTGQANLDGWMIDDFTFDTDNIICAGISDENFENLVVLSPNPTNDFINISIDETLKNNELSISFFDLLGNKLKEEKLYNNNSRLDISNWQNGFYFYQIKQKEQIIKSGKLIKE